jgi:hypothetical protein
MANEASRGPARDPRDRERLFVSRERAGDVDGMAALHRKQHMGKRLRYTTSGHAPSADLRIDCDGTG